MKRFLFGLILACAPALSSHAANNGFLTIPSIPGDSLDEFHPGSIVVMEFQHTVERSAAGVPVGTFSITKSIDKATLALAKAAATGTPIPQVTFAARKPGTKADFYLVTMENVVVVSFDQVANGGEFVETVAFSVSKISYTYFGQKPDGSMAEPVGETALMGVKKQP